MTKFRKRLQDKLRRKYGWHSATRGSSDYCAFLCKQAEGGWVYKHPELGRATITTDVEVGGVLGDVHVMLTEEFFESHRNDFNRSIGCVLSFEELESLYLVAKEIHENRQSLKVKQLSLFMKEKENV